MAVRKPDYFDRFHCIGGACSDTCCAGWEIEVDEESCNRYLKMKGKTGKRLRQELTVTPEESFFALKDGKCPFLNQEGLCDLILAEGEDILCDICREHPRFYNWYGSQTEIGLGMCCEEAERLMFADSKPASFVTEQLENQEEENQEEEAFVQKMMTAREAAFQIVQNRAMPFHSRLLLLARFAEELQMLLDADQMEELEHVCNMNQSEAEQFLNEYESAVENASANDAVVELLEKYAALEALDESWPVLLQQAAKETETLLSQSSAFICQYSQTAWEYEHLIVYFLNRYFMESVFDMDVLSKVRFGLAALIIIRLLELENWTRTNMRTTQNRDDIVRRYSKEIEYCPENVTALTEDCWTLGSLQTERLGVMIKALFM